MHALKAAIAAGFAAFATQAFATHANIVFTVTATPATVTLSSPALETFAAYQVHITNDSPYNAGSVKWKGKTTVIGASASAPFVSASGASCAPVYAAPSSAVECHIGNLGAYASVSFSVTFAAPAEGEQIKLASRSFFRSVDLGPYAPLEATAEQVTITQLAAPNPLQVATVLPQATGGTVFTGSNAGVALADDVSTTTVNVPSAATVSIDETPVTESPICPGVPVCPPNTTLLTIPGLFDQLVIKLRLDASVVPTKAKGPKGPAGHKSDDEADDDELGAQSGGGGQGRKLSIRKAKVYYQADATDANPFPQPVEVLSCHVTGGPTPGTPCIASRTAYKKKNAPSPDYVGDWEFVIFAVDNGRYRF